jgi:hypothetical protein
MTSAQLLAALANGPVTLHNLVNSQLEVPILDSGMDLTAYTAQLVEIEMMAASMGLTFSEGGSIGISDDGAFNYRIGRTLSAPVGPLEWYGSMDTFVQRVKAAGKLTQLRTRVNSVMTQDEKFEFDHSTRLLNTATPVLDLVAVLELDPQVILAPDPLMA